MSYLILFRIEELGMGHLKKFMATQDTKKIFKVAIWLANHLTFKCYI